MLPIDPGSADLTLGAGVQAHRHTRITINHLIVIARSLSTARDGVIDHPDFGKRRPVLETMRR